MMLMSPPSLMDFRADFSGRANNATNIGADFRSDYDNMKIDTGRAQISTPGSSTGRQGAWETYELATDYNGGRLLTDNWTIEDTVQTPIGAQALDNVSSVGAGMLDAGPGAGMVLIYGSYLQGAVSGTGMAIYTMIASSIASPGHATTLSGGTNNMTVRGTTATNRAASGDVMSMTREMYSSTQSIFRLLQNGTVRCTWDDSTGIVPAGSSAVGKRRWFFQKEGNFPLFSGGPYYTIATQRIRAYDRRI